MKKEALYSCLMSRVISEKFLIAQASIIKSDLYSGKDAIFKNNW